MKYLDLLFIKKKRKKEKKRKVEGEKILPIFETGTLH
jgi:hypothetical protein